MRIQTLTSTCIQAAYFSRLLINMKWGAVYSAIYRSDPHRGHKVPEQPQIRLEILNEEELHSVRLVLGSGLGAGGVQGGGEGGLKRDIFFLKTM